MRLTQRGRVVALLLVIAASATVGFATAEWCYWGRCDRPPMNCDNTCGR